MGNDAADSASRSTLTATSPTISPILAVLVVLVMVISGLAMVGAIGLALPVAHVPMPTAASASGGTPASATTAASFSSPSVSAVPTLAAREALASADAAESKAAGVPTRDYYPPDFLQSGLTPTHTANGPVIIPHPRNDSNAVGLGTIGVDNSTGTPVGTEFNSSSWEGTVTINEQNSYNFAAEGNASGIQLNTVADNITVQNSTTPGSFWTQDVMFMEPLEGYAGVYELEMLDNVWDFSSTSGAEPATVFYGNNTNHWGYNGTHVGTEYYYDELPLEAYFEAPLTVDLWTNVSLIPSPLYGPNAVGYNPIVWRPAVTFGYSINAAGVVALAPTPLHENFDRVVFNNTDNDTNKADYITPDYLVDGRGLAPIGYLPYDSELILGGPGGGSQANFYSFNGTMSLRYWNSATSAWTIAPDALDYGFDTGETAVGVAEHYVVPGTVYLEGGAAMGYGLWGSVPGGNQGTLTVKINEPAAPANPWIFLGPGAINPARAVDQSQWVPTMDETQLVFDLAPGAYEGWAGYANYDPVAFNIHGTNGQTSTWNIVGTANFAEGVYTPLVAWSAADLAAQTWAGTDTLWNNPSSDGYLSPLFLAANDFLLPTFSGIEIVGVAGGPIVTHTNISNPAPFDLDFQMSPYWTHVFGALGIGTYSNELGIDISEAQGVSVWDANLNGWLSDLTSPSPISGWPIASVVLWNVSDAVVGDSHFADASAGLMIFNDTYNVAGLSYNFNDIVWGNVFAPSPDYPWAQPGMAIQVYQSTDTIFNNILGTTPEAYSPSGCYYTWIDYGYTCEPQLVAGNFLTGYPQTNINNWNLGASTPTPVANTTSIFAQGFDLTGSITGSELVCGNAWSGEVPGAAYGLPYNVSGFSPSTPGSVGYFSTDTGLIMQGGDYCPQNLAGKTPYAVTLVQKGLPYSGHTGYVSGSQFVDFTWGASVGTASMTGNTTWIEAGGFSNGYLDWSAMPVPNYVAVPSSGVIHVDGAPVSLTINYVEANLTILTPFDPNTVEGIPLYQAPSYNLYINWTDSWGAAYNGLISQALVIINAATGANASGKTATMFGSATAFDVLPASYAPGCYVIAVGAYNSTEPGVNESAGPITGWAASGEDEFCVASVAAQTVVPGIQPAGNVSFFYAWNAPGASAATVTVWSGNSPVFGPVSVWSTTGAGSGTYATPIEPPTLSSYNIEVAVNVNGAVVSTNVTFQVSPVVPIPTHVTFYNTTTNYYYNKTTTLPAGLTAGALGAVLLDVGVIVGAIVGIIIGMSLARRKQPPMGGDMGMGSSSGAAGGPKPGSGMGGS